jgi:hypothetical protein
VNARLLLLSVPLLCAACGGSSSPPSAGDAQNAVREYFKAIGNGDADGACRQLSPAAQKQLESAAKVTSCRQAGTELVNAFTDDDRKAIRKVKVGAVHVSGNKATVVITGPTSDDPALRTSKVPLEIIGGHWQIEQLSNG